VREERDEETRVPVFYYEGVITMLPSRWNFYN